MLEKISASILHSKGDKGKSEESVLGVSGFFFFKFLFVNIKEL